MALRHQQSSPSWWGAGWGHGGGIPKKLGPRLGLHWLAAGGDTALLRTGCDPGRGMQAGDTASPELGPLSPTALHRAGLTTPDKGHTTSPAHPALPAAPSLPSQGNAGPVEAAYRGPGGPGVPRQKGWRGCSSGGASHP